MRNFIVQIEESIDAAAHNLNKDIGRSLAITYENCIQVPLYCDFYGYILEVEYKDEKPVSVSLLREAQGFFEDACKIFILENKDLQYYIENVLMYPYDDK